MKYAWIIWYAIFLHTWWGLNHLINPPVGEDWHGGVSWNIYINLGGGDLWATAMLVAAVLAVISFFMTRGSISVLMMLPQQAILTIGAIGIFTSLTGYFYPFETSRVLRVAPLPIGAFIFHTLAILDYHDVFRWKT